ncbi:transposase [Thiocystis violascens DSM 198]|uniref:Transposase n=1 Tax=Thiocystis violascens (strain ATCC 17096 / DSM 198 / 6111) TaxID=765911 RepID=I3YBJ8_THIV6|nr:transposase [Thiocystis violascens DSM 198]
MSDEPQAELFADERLIPEVPTPSGAPQGSVARVRWPNRTPLELRPCDQESLLSEARLVWAWGERCDLSAMYAGIRAVEGGSGRTAIAPEILFALWLYVTLDGVGSARVIARLTREHDAYRWICGGVAVNDHTLSDFRSAHGAALDALLGEHVALLLAEGVVTLKRVARTVRACAPVPGPPHSAGAPRWRNAFMRRAPTSRGSSATSTTTRVASRAVVRPPVSAPRALERLPEMAAIKATQCQSPSKNDQGSTSNVFPLLGHFRWSESPFCVA